jgi:acyl dehydratase
MAIAMLKKSHLPAAHISIYWEDLVPGSVRELGGVTVLEKEMLAFAKQFDPQPFHLNRQAGEDSIFGDLCASGWHTCSMAMRLTVDNLLKHSSSLGSPGLESVKWVHPVFAQDVLTLRHTVLESRPLRKRLDVGLVLSVWEMFNQTGDMVLRMEGYGMFGRRTPGEPLPGGPEGT